MGLMDWLTGSRCAGASEEVVVTPYDSFGNPGASGGRLAAELAQEGGEPPNANPIPCQVIESTTGGPPALLEPAVSEQDVLTLVRLDAAVLWHLS